MDPTRVARFIAALLEIDWVGTANILTLASRESSLDEVVTGLVVPALERIGDDWVAGKVSLSEVYMSSRICEELMMPLASRAGAPRRSQPRIAIAALQDYHLLGKKLVELALRSSGYEPLDYGQGVRAEGSSIASARPGFEVLLISTLMLPSALRVRDLREKLDRAGLRPIIVVGGAPFRFDDRLWRDVGADAMGRSASDALKILDGIMEGTRACSATA